MGVLSRYLLVQSHQLKSVWNLFRVNKKNHQRRVIDVVPMSLVINLTELVSCSGVSFVDFEQVNAGWVVLLSIVDFKQLHARQISSTKAFFEFSLKRQDFRKYVQSYQWRYYDTDFSGVFIPNFQPVSDNAVMLFRFQLAIQHLKLTVKKTEL